jgi:hypothetical protein
MSSIYFRILKKCCRDTYLINFQYKFLHRVIPTNTFLFKIHIKDTKLCSFCNVEDEMVEHLHFLRIRKYIDQSAMSIPSISSHFKNFWMGRWVNVFNKVIYTNFKLFVFIILSKKSSFGWKFSVLILSMLSFKHFNISRNVWEYCVISNEGVIFN